MVLGLASLVISLYSAHAIRWFFSPLDSIDLFEPVMTWMLAGAFGVMGYFITRGLAFRMMNKERVGGYVFICLLVEFVEIFCNVSEALVTMHSSNRFEGFSVGVQTVLMVVACVVWSCVPLLSIGLAVLDMDMEREKRGMTPHPKTAGPGGVAPGGAVPVGRNQPGLQPLVPYPASRPTQPGAGYAPRPLVPGGRP
jgi:hypothetical protein